MKIQKSVYRSNIVKYFPIFNIGYFTPKLVTDTYSKSLISIIKSNGLTNFYFLPISIKLSLFLVFPSRFVKTLWTNQTPKYHLLNIDHHGDESIIMMGEKFCYKKGFAQKKKIIHLCNTVQFASPRI